MARNLCCPLQADVGARYQCQWCNGDQVFVDWQFAQKANRRGSSIADAGPAPPTRLAGVGAVFPQLPPHLPDPPQ